MSELNKGKHAFKWQLDLEMLELFNFYIPARNSDDGDSDYILWTTVSLDIYNLDIAWSRNLNALRKR